MSTPNLYVCEFSTGIIKVGLTSDGERRIAEHCAVASRFGVEIVRNFLVDVAGDGNDAEAKLIDLCANAGTQQHGKEWFCNLEFDTVCQWAREASSAEPDEQSNLSGLHRLRNHLRSLPDEAAREAFAIRAGTSIGHLRNCISQQKNIAPDVCVQIERLSSCAVRRWHLRPDWSAIWPELINAPGAPRVPRTRAVA